MVSATNVLIGYFQLDLTNEAEYLDLLELIQE